MPSSGNRRNGSPTGAVAHRHRPRTHEYAIPVTTATLPPTVTRSRFALGLTWLVLATSSIVFVEPAPYDVLVVALAAVFFTAGLRIPSGLGGALILMAVFALANVIAGAASADPAASIRYMLITFYLVLTWVFFTSLIAEDPQRVIEVIWSGYTVAAIVAVTLGIAGYFRMVPNYEWFLYQGRASGAFKDANVYGPFLVPVAIHLGTKLERGFRVPHLVTLALFLFVVGGILLSFSRGAWGNLAVTGVAYFILRAMTAKTPGQMGRLLAVGAGLFAGAAFVIAWAITTPDVGVLFHERALLFQEYDLAADGRFNSLLAALEESFRNPVGIGPGRSAYVFPTEPHNIYLHVLVETGWLGAIAFLGFVLFSVWRGLRFCLHDSPMQHGAIVILAALIGTLADNFVVHGTHWRHFYLLFAMLWGTMLAFQASPGALDMLRRPGTIAPGQ
jgi:hypothetical protein